MSARDLTGRWEGIFNYPHALPPNGFVAVLVDHAGTIMGKVQEVSDDPADVGQPLVATMQGERIGTSVSFVKRYRGARADHPVRYAGTVAPDGDEIVGEWTIPGVWSGSFIMVRASGRPAAVEELVGEEVR